MYVGVSWLQAVACLPPGMKAFMFPAGTTPTSQLLTGAGATFPYPIYAKWADAYKLKTGTGWNVPPGVVLRVK